MPSQHPSAHANDQQRVPRLAAHGYGFIHPINLWRIPHMQDKRTLAPPAIALILGETSP